MRQKLANEIKDKIKRYIPFAGLAKDGEVVLRVDLDQLASSLADTVIGYIEEATLKELRNFLKRLVTE